MITINNKEYRNLEEQVLKNKEDIAKHYQAMQLPLNLAGIEVVGTIGIPSDLDGVVGTKYGDAYVMVLADGFTVLWIWTRANPNAGHDSDYWLDIPFSVVGPQGPKGEQGEQGLRGIRGSQWFSGTGQPYDISNYNVGDYYINVQTGNIWHLHDNPVRWLKEGNIKGPQGAQGNTGPQGPQGPRGERGETGPEGPRAPGVVINRILDSVDELPTPSTLNDLSAAFLIRSAGGNILYVQVGTTAANAVWTNMGYFNGGTTVFVNGEAVTTFDANSKLDKVTSASSATRAYVVEGTGQQALVQVSGQVSASSIARRHTNGRLRVGKAEEVDEAMTLGQLTDSILTLYHHKINIPIHNTDNGVLLYNLAYHFYSMLDEAYVIQSEDVPIKIMESMVGQGLYDTTGYENNLLRVIGFMPSHNQQDEYYITLSGFSEPNPYSGSFTVYTSEITEDVNSIYEP